MRTPEEIRKEITRLETEANRKRIPQYKAVALHVRIESLRWALGEETVYDDEQR